MGVEGIEHLIEDRVFYIVQLEAARGQMRRDELEYLFEPVRDVVEALDAAQVEHRFFSPGLDLEARALLPLGEIDQHVVHDLLHSSEPQNKHVFRVDEGLVDVVAVYVLHDGVCYAEVVRFRPLIEHGNARRKEQDIRKGC